MQVRVEVANVEVDERGARTAEASDEDAEAVVAAVRRWQDPARRTNRRASARGSDPEAEDDDDAGFLVLDDAMRGMWRRHVDSSRRATKVWTSARGNADADAA